ncbi:MAG: ATP-binding cassette domain-containing protein [Rhizobiaceae bacterium]|jgi:NitT/TauT family transport system ATP-binding protein|nr:ATP-binding cassette domain-containing protein [Rhizobiaceae bacterium]
MLQPAVQLALRSMDYGEGPVLGPLSLNVAADETLAVLGPSGVGKTTLMRIIAGLETRFSGARTVNGRLAMVFQEPTLLPWRTAADNLAITTGASPEAIRAALNEVDLDGLAGRFPSQLSVGQQRRLALARAFAARPDILLMDEPFVSLDEALADEMLALFERLRAARKLATVLITHSSAEARRLATRIVRLEGRPATLHGL